MPTDYVYQDDTYDYGTNDFYADVVDEVILAADGVVEAVTPALVEGILSTFVEHAVSDARDIVASRPPNTVNRDI